MRVKQPSLKRDRQKAADHGAVQVIQVLRKAVVEMYSVWMNSVQCLMQMTAFTVAGEHRDWGFGRKAVSCCHLSDLDETRRYTGLTPWCAFAAEQWLCNCSHGGQQARLKAGGRMKCWFLNFSHGVAVN